MKRRILLRPEQSASFEMGRILLVHAGWETRQFKPLSLELGMLLDFVVQNPRLFVNEVPALAHLIKVFGFEKADLGEIFAQSRFNTLREKYIETISGLVGKDLLQSSEEDSVSDVTGYRLTPTGRKISEEFDSELAVFIVQVTRKLAEAWASTEIGKLSLVVRKELPDHSMLAHELLTPFRDWVENAE